MASSMESFNNSDNNLLAMKISGEAITGNIGATSPYICYNIESIMGSEINHIMDVVVPFLEHDDVDVNVR